MTFVLRAVGGQANFRPAPRPKGKSMSGTVEPAWAPDMPCCIRGLSTGGVIPVWTNRFSNSIHGLF